MSFAVEPDRLRAAGRAIAETAARTSGDLDRLHRAVHPGRVAPLGPAYEEVVALTGEALGLVGDEERIAALAEGWRARGARLEVARRDHGRAAHGIRVHNGGAGVAAFVQWAGRLDDGLLRFVEICARVEAALLRAARTVLTAKNAIRTTLDDLAAWLDDAERHARVSGGGEPVVDAARQRISVALDDVDRQLADDVLPALALLAEQDRTLVEELRRLVVPSP